MLGILDALNSYDIGHKVTRQYDLEGLLPDEFEFSDYYGVVRCASCDVVEKGTFNYDPYKTSQQYYKIAFAYYWEHAIFLDMSKRAVVLTPNNIRYEMIQSLRTLNELSDNLIKSVTDYPDGANWQRFIANRGYSRQYGKILCQTFFNDPASIDALGNAVLNPQGKRMCSNYTLQKGIIRSVIVSLNHTDTHALANDNGNVFVEKTL